MFGDRMKNDTVLIYERGKKVFKYEDNKKGVKWLKCLEINSKFHQY